MRVDGKTVLITGAASGIGRATAVKAAARGASLVLTDVNAEGLAEVAESLGSAVKHSEALDITDYEAVCALAEKTAPVDIVMNIAGVSAWGSVDKLEHRHWRKMVEVNLMGPIHVIEAFIPPMMEARKGGHLVNVSSAAGLFGLPWHAAYSASKFGLRGVSEVLRFDLKRHRIGVTLVCPGGVDTGLVNTIEIAGVNRDDPTVLKLVDRFRKHAKSPEHVAEKIIEGVEKNRYMVTTSPEIAVGYWFQRKFALPYEIVMQQMNHRLTKIGRRASV